MDPNQIPDFDLTLEYLQFQYEKKEEEEERKARITRKNKSQRKKKEKERTPNHLFVWEAIGYCASENKQYPEWVRKYLTNVSFKLLAIRSPGGRAAELIKDALGFEDATVFNRHITTKEKQQVFLKVEREIGKRGEGQIRQIFSDVATEFQRLVETRGKDRYDEATIQKIYNEMKKLSEKDIAEDTKLWKEHMDKLRLAKTGNDTPQSGVSLTTKKHP